MLIHNLDHSSLEAQINRVGNALITRDFAGAQVRKLHHVSLGKIYRARLNDADRLLFSLYRHEDETVLLFLEVVRAHRYEQSRFLRGAQIASEKIICLQEAAAEADSLRYLSSGPGAVHFLDKPLSFDATQDALFTAPLPMLLVGGAGSGKTALLLEKLKTLGGEVLYVTHSAFLGIQSHDPDTYAAGLVHLTAETAAARSNKSRGLATLGRSTWISDSVPTAGDGDPGWHGVHVDAARGRDFTYFRPIGIRVIFASTAGSNAG